MGIAKIKEVIEKIQGVKVLVIGDLMVDEFLTGKVSRISPEAPVPVLEFSSHSFLPGGAANTAVNITSLGGQPILVGCIGDDAAGENLIVELSSKGIEIEKIVKDQSRRTTLKTRVIAHTQQVVRIDREDIKLLQGEAEEKMLENIESAIPGCQIVLFSDYTKGAITPKVIKKAREVCRKNNIRILVDTKTDDPNYYIGIDYIKPNILEAERLSGIKIFNEESLFKAAERILDLLKAKGVIITRAEQGISLFTPGKNPVHIEAKVTEVHDVTGAGDTVCAALALGMGAKMPLENAAQLANLAAGVVVRKIGTAQARPEEIIRLVDEVNQIE